MKIRGRALLTILLLGSIIFCGCTKIMGKDTEQSSKILETDSKNESQSVETVEDDNNKNKEMKTAYSLYYSKLIEEYVNYGLGEDNPDGLMTCDLIDFTGDGLKELFYVVCREDSIYTVCVYTYDEKNKRIKSIFEWDPGTHGTIMPLRGQGKNYLLSSNFVGECVNEYSIAEFKDDKFQYVKIYTEELEELVDKNGGPSTWVPSFYIKGSSTEMKDEDFLKDISPYGITSVKDFSLLFSQYCGRGKQAEKSLLKVTSEINDREVNYSEDAVIGIGEKCLNYLGNSTWPDVMAVTDLDLDGDVEVIVGDASSSGAIGILAYQFKENKLQELELKTVNTTYFRNLTEFNDSDMKLYTSNEDGSEHIFSVRSNGDVPYCISEYSKEGLCIYRNLIAEINQTEDEKGNKVTKYILEGKETTEEKYKAFIEKWKSKFSSTNKLHSDNTLVYLENNFDFGKLMFDYAIGLSSVPSNLNENLMAENATLKVEIQDNMKAVFKLTIPGLEERYLTDLPGTEIQSAEYIFRVKFDDYSLDLVNWSFSPGKAKLRNLIDMQSSLSKKREGTDSFDYIKDGVPVRKEENSIVWELDTSIMEGVNLNNINQYTVELLYPKKGYPGVQEESKELEFGKREVSSN